MKPLLTRKLVAAAITFVVLGGAAGALAATQLSSSSSGRQAYIDEVASHLGVSPSALTAAMKAASIDQVNAAVAAGRITRSQADLLTQRIDQGIGTSFPAGGFGHPLGLGQRFGRSGGGFAGFGTALGGLRVAAQYLGISGTTLRRDLQSGKSLAQITSATSGKSTSGLTSAIVAAARTRLDTAVSSGVITGRQEQQQLADLSSRVDALIQRARGSWSASARTGMGFAHMGRGFARQGMGFARPGFWRRPPGSPLAQLFAP